MDPVSRQQAWDLIASVKPGRVVILTTHSMTEADVLGDRIGIIAAGRLRCVGPSIRLKAKWGTGYSFLLKLKGESTLDRGGSAGRGHQDAVSAAASSAGPPSRHPLDSLQHLTPGLSSLHEAILKHFGPPLTGEMIEMKGLGSLDMPGGGRCMTIRVPQDTTSSQLLGMLESLESDEAIGWGVCDVAISLTSLEEVYLRVISAANDGGTP